MKTVTLKIQDDYFDKIISFLEILPKKAVKIEKQEEEKKLKEIEKSIICSFDDIEQGRTKNKDCCLSSLLGVIIEETDTFAKSIKKLQKRFKNVEADCEEFVQSIQTTEHLGTNLGNGIFKVRIANSDKKSGKSAGYRLISYLKLIDNKLYLMYIYDKSDLDTVSEKQIDTLIKKTILEKTNKK